MNALSLTSDSVTLIRAEDGVSVVVPNGTELLVLDDLNDDKYLKNHHASAQDYPCMYGDVLHFVDSALVVGPNQYAQYVGQRGDE